MAKQSRKKLERERAKLFAKQAKLKRARERKRDAIPPATYIPLRVESVRWTGLRARLREDLAAEAAAAIPFVVKSLRP
jgi:hypothetical protein